MRVTSVLLIGVLACSPADGAELRITAPRDGDFVDHRANVEGRVSGPRPGGATVWVVIHPKARSTYWVQPLATTKADGSWAVEVYFGTPNVGSGEKFDIRAVWSPLKPLMEGDQLPNWPGAAMTSDMITVTRR